jgi:Kef-type K+ transport system membrane component KefB
MTDLPILRDLGIIVITAAVFALLGTRLRAPSIIAYIAAGLVLGPVVALLAAADTVALIAETGIVLLLFIVGLELSLDKIRDVGRVAVLAGLGQVVFTAAGGLGLSMLLGFEFVPALVIAVALTFSSTVVVVKLLTQKGELDRLYGRIAVGIFLVQDLVVVMALTLLTGIGDPSSMSIAAILRGIGLAFAGMLLLLAIALFAARFILPRAFRWMAPSQEGILIWSLAWCFLFVAAAELFHLSVEIGAFLAGLSLAQLPYNHDLRRRVRPLMNFFVMVFFVSLGVQMEIGAALAHWPAAVVLSLFVLIGNPIIFMLIIARMGYAERTAFMTSVTVAQISEFSFVFAALGLASGLIDESVLSLIGIVGLVTIGASVYMILYNHQIYDMLARRGLLRWLRAAPSLDVAEEGSELRDHVIVVGMNALGRRMVDGLIAQGEEVIAIDTDATKLDELPCRTLHGTVDDLSVLEEAGFRRARLLVSALQIENTNALLAYRGRSAGVATSIHAFDQGLVDELLDSGATHVLQSKNAGIRRLTGVLRELGLLRT